MSTGAKVGIWLGVLIALSAIGYVIYRILKNPDSSNCADGFNFVNGTCVPTGTGVNNNGTGGGNTGGGSNNGGSNTPPPPATTNWEDFRVGDRVFAVTPVDAWDRDTLGYHGYLGKLLKTFQPNAYIGTVSTIIPYHGLMVKNSNVKNPNFGDPIFILGLNSQYRKG